MKIIQVITRMILGGAQEVVVMTCAALVKAGHEVVLLYGPDTGPEGSLVEAVRGIPGAGVRLIEMTSMVRQVSPATDWRCYRELRALFRGEKPDVVHTHSSKAGIVGRAAAWAEGVPCVIHTCHGVGFYDGQNPLAYRLYVRAERWAARRCHHLIAVSPQMVDIFEAKRIAPREKMTVIGSAVDMKRFDRGVVNREDAKVAKGFLPGAGADAPVIGLLARLDTLKGHRDLIDVLPRLIERFPLLRVVFIGDGYDRAMIEGYVREAGMAERVTFTGLVPRDEVPPWLHAVDVSVLPSCQEGQSITLLQSLLCGCGIVGYDVGGIPSVCIPEQTGKLVPLGDKAVLADAIIWMLEHPAERAAMTERGKALARERFSPQRMTDATLEVYGKVLGRRL